MSGFLGYDPIRIRTLWTLCTEVLDGLGELRSIDPLADEALAAVRGLTARIEEALPLVVTLALGRTMEGYERRGPDRLDRFVPLDGGDHLLSAARRGGWRVRRDLLGVRTGPSPLRPAQASELARRLGTAREIALATASPDETAYLAAQLESLLTDPAAVTAFTAAFTGWQRLVEDLVTRHARTPLPGISPSVGSDDTRDWEAANRLLSAIARVYRAGVLGPDPSARPDLLDTLDPLAAALLLVHLDHAGRLDDDVAAGAAVGILDRAHASAASGRRMIETFAGRKGPSAADVVVDHIGTDPERSRALLVAAAARPEILFHQLRSQEDVVARVLLSATDPTTTDAATAGAIIVPVLRWAREVHLRELSTAQPPRTGWWLGPLVAPHLLSFNARSREWPWDYEEATDVMTWLTGDAAVWAQLSAGLRRATSALEARLASADGDVRRQALQALELTFAQINEVALRHQIRRGAQERFWTDVMLEFAPRAVTSLLTRWLPSHLGSSVSRAVDVGSAHLDRMLQRSGTAPPDGESVKQSARDAYVDRMVRQTLAVVTLTVVALHELGQLPDSAVDGLAGLDPQRFDLHTCGRDADEAIAEYIAGLEAPDDVKDAISSAASSFLNVGQAVSTCAR